MAKTKKRSTKKAAKKKATRKNPVDPNLEFAPADVLESMQLIRGMSTAQLRAVMLEGNQSGKQRLDVEKIPRTDRTWKALEKKGLAKWSRDEWGLTEKGRRMDLAIAHSHDVARGRYRADAAFGGFGVSKNPKATKKKATKKKAAKRKASKNPDSESYQIKEKYAGVGGNWVVHRYGGVGDATFLLGPYQLRVWTDDGLGWVPLRAPSHGWTLKVRDSGDVSRHAKFKVLKDVKRRGQSPKDTFQWKGYNQASRAGYYKFPYWNTRMRIDEVADDAVKSANDFLIASGLTRNPKRKTAKRKPAKKKPVKNPHSKVSLAIAKWYEKKGWMTPEIKMDLARAGNPKLLLSRLYVDLVFEDTYLHWMSFRPMKGDFGEFERKAGVKREGLQKLMDRGFSLNNKLSSDGASAKSDKFYESLAKAYGGMYLAIKGDKSLLWFQMALVPLVNGNEMLSHTWRNINSPSGIPGTLDGILKYCVRPRFMGGSSLDEIIGSIFQEAILRATHKSAADKGRTLPHTRRNPTKKKPAKKPTKKKATKKKVTSKKTPTYQLLINRCQKLWDHYCERPSKSRLKPVLEHLEKMKASTSKKVADERKRCLRVANKEARRLKMK